MRQKKLLFTCVLGLLLFSGRDANAFWKYIYELSGPGYFVGVDFVFPRVVFAPKLTDADMNRNRPALRRLGVALPKFSGNLAGFLDNEAHCRFFTRTLAMDEEKVCAAKSFGIFDVETKFAVNGETAAILADLLSPPDSPPTDGDTGELRFWKLQRAVNEQTNRNILQKISRFGAGPVGLFGSQQPLPKLAADCGLPSTHCPDLNRNLFFTVALGLAFSQENNLTFAPDHDGDTDVIWLSLYPALEKRIRLGSGENYSLFANAGVAFHRFVGAGFEDFSRWSVKSRLGIRFLQMFHFGGEIEYFNEAIPHAQFGSVQDGALDRTSWGLFFGLELVRPLNN